MRRTAIVFCLSFFFGCSLQSNPDSEDLGKDADVEDGGLVGNADLAGPKPISLR